MKAPYHSTQFRLEPQWRPVTRLHQVDLPRGLRGWLLDAGSLTRRLRQACPGQIRVQVLRQYWARPLPSEVRILSIEHQTYAWIREVQLFCGDQLWVFARTLIPPLTLQGRCQRLTRLGERPLGEVLFNVPGVQRGEVEIAHIGASHRLHRRAFGDLPETSDAIWGRRSIFHIDGRPLLVCEIFLPGLPAP